MKEDKKLNDNQYHHLNDYEKLILKKLNNIEEILQDVTTY